MKERGILFQAPLVRAILAGQKTQTRRLATPNQPIPESLAPFEMRKDPVFGTWVLGPAGLAMVPFFQAAHGWVNKAFGTNRYGVPGDRLWVRETWAIYHDHAATVGAKDALRDARERMPWARILFRADANGGHADASRVEDKWRPATHLPRWASRITLEITSVRVERLQDITEEDAKAEGVEVPDGLTAVSAFALLWNRINDAKVPWSSNPWVWRIEFRRLP